MNANLDETDLQILKTLQKNAKLTTKELADAVNLTPPPVFERQKRLERKGYIRKYIAVLDPEKLDLGLLVFCKVKLKQIWCIRLPIKSARTRYETISGVCTHKTRRHRLRGFNREHLRHE